VVRVSQSVSQGKGRVVQGAGFRIEGLRLWVEDLGETLNPESNLRPKLKLM